MAQEWTLARREQTHRAFLEMYASRVKPAMDTFHEGGEAAPVLLAELPDDGVVKPDMLTRSLTLSEAAALLDKERLTVRVLLERAREILNQGLAHRRCAVALLFPDGEVHYEVVHVRRKGATAA